MTMKHINSYCRYYSINTLLVLLLLFVPRILFAKELKLATVNVTGSYSGASYEVLNLIVEQAGFQYTNTPIPFHRILSGLKDGSVDLALLVPNPKLEKIATPLIYVRDFNFIVVGKTGSKLNNKQQLTGKRVAHLRNAAITSKLVQGIDAHFIQANNYKQLIKMLVTERIDYIVGPKSNIFTAYNESEYANNGVKIEEALFLKSFELHLMYSKKSAEPEVASALIKATKQLHQENKITLLLERYDY